MCRRRLYVARRLSTWRALEGRPLTGPVEESRRLQAVLARRSRPRRRGRAAVANDLLAADEQPVDAVRAAEDERRDRVVRPGRARAPSVRQTARSAHRPGSSAPMSSRRSTAAPPRVPSRSASRAVIAAGPAAAARDEQRLLHLEDEVAALVRRGAVDAEPDADARVDAARAPARRRRPAGGSRSGSARRRCPVSANRATSRVGEVDAVRAPDVLRRASRAARGTRPAGSRRAPRSTPPPRPSRPGACAAAARAGERARPTPPSAAR